MFENEITILKGQKHAANQRSNQDMLKTSMVLPNMKLAKGSKTTSPIRKSYVQIVASSSAQRTTENTWKEVIDRNHKCKSTTQNSSRFRAKEKKSDFLMGIHFCSKF